MSAPDPGVVPLVPPAYRRDGDPSTRGDLDRIDARIVAQRDELAAILAGVVGRLIALVDHLNKSDAQAVEHDHRTHQALRDIQGQVDALGQRFAQDHDHLRDQLDVVVAGLPRRRQAQVRRRLGEPDWPRDRRPAGADERQPWTDPDQTQELPALPTAAATASGNQRPAVADRPRWSPPGELPAPAQRRSWSVQVPRWPGRSSG